MGSRCRSASLAVTAALRIPKGSHAKGHRGVQWAKPRLLRGWTPRLSSCEGMDSSAGSHSHLSLGKSDEDMRRLRAPNRQAMPASNQQPAGTAPVTPQCMGTAG